MKEKLIKKLSKFIPIDIILKILFWKIKETHNLKESNKYSCFICNSYYDLIDELKDKHNVNHK